MGCQIYHSHPRILFKIPINKPKFQYKTMALSSSYNTQDQEPVSISTISGSKPDVYSVKFKTLGDCKLGISRYPDFEYNALGGEGSGTGKKMVGVDFNGESSVDFDVKRLYIPPLSTATTKFLGLPLPPFLKIDIVPEIFRGIINLESGKVEALSLYKFLARLFVNGLI